jgi:putative transposase
MSPEESVALAAGGIGAAGEQHVLASLSVLFHNVCGMRVRQFRYTPDGARPLGLQLVWCPNYRPGVLGGGVARRLDEVMGQISAAHGWLIVAHEVMPDHVRLFVRVGSADAPASVARAFKGRTTWILRRAFPYLRNHAKVMWWPSGMAVRRFIEHRWDAVLLS